MSRIKGNNNAFNGESRTSRVGQDNRYRLTGATNVLLAKAQGIWIERDYRRTVYDWHVLSYRWRWRIVRTARLIGHDGTGASGYASDYAAIDATDSTGACCIARKGRMNKHLSLTYEIIDSRLTGLET